MIWVVGIVILIGSVWLYIELHPQHRFIDACGSKPAAVVLEFIEKSADVNKAGWFGLTPLGEAIRHAQAENVRLLIEHGALLTLPGATQSHLHTAVKDSTPEIAQVLLDSGADPNAKDRNGESPLRAAVWKLNVPMVRLLLDSGADANDAGSDDFSHEPIVVTAVSIGNKGLSDDDADRLIEIVGMLLDHGASINQRSRGGAPLVGIAMPEVRLLRYLVERGAIIDVRWEELELGEIIPTLLDPHHST